jgi:hypothetical protein
MSTQKLIYLAKEARSIMAFCEESLLLLGKHLAANSLHQPDMHLQTAPAQDQDANCSRAGQDTARQTRALAEDFRDPEIRRLLCALADKYEEMASSDGEPEPAPTASFWK